MRDRILCVSLVIFLAGNVAFSQAIAESVLLNGNSAAATAKAGAVLSKGLNKTTGTVAGQIQAVPQSKIATHPDKGVMQSTSHPHTKSMTTGNSGSMITSIQGGRVTRSSATPTAAPHN